MKVMSQVVMVMNLDKCIGCHTCSVTCKQAWTNREGTEYMWFNNVETRPGVGYPRTWEDQERWKGGWRLTKSGKLVPRSGGRLKKLATIFANPDMPEIDDYYEPWTYDYDRLLQTPAGAKAMPTARARSQMTGKTIDTIEWARTGTITWVVRLRPCMRTRRCPRCSLWFRRALKKPSCSTCRVSATTA